MKIEYTLDLPLFGTPLEGMEDEIAATFLREFSSTVGEVRKLLESAVEIASLKERRSLFPKRHTSAGDKSPRFEEGRKR